jgi:hypothetical protein
VVISLFNESDRKFYRIQADPTSPAVGLFTQESDADPLMMMQAKGAHFVVKNAG